MSETCIRFTVYKLGFRFLDEWSCGRGKMTSLRVDGRNNRISCRRSKDTSHKETRENMLERIPRESYCKGKDFKGHFLHMRGNAHGVSSGSNTIVKARERLHTLMMLH
jgi:hypothetical protein